MVEPAAAGLPDLTEHVRRLVRHVRRQPFREKILQLKRQPEQDDAGGPGAGGGRLFQDRFHLLIVEGRDHRRHHHRHRDAGLAQGPDGLQPFAGPRRPGLEGPGQLGVEGAHRDTDRRQALPGHRPEDIHIAADQGRLGGDGNRMVEARQNFQHAPGNPVFLLDRLVGIGVGAKLKGLRPIARFRQFPFQESGGAGLGEQPAFEIEPRRKAQVSVGRAGEAIDAAVLAPPVGIDGTVEGNVRRRVAGNDGLRVLYRHLGAKRRQIAFVQVPAVVDGFPGLGLETAGGVANRAPALEWRWGLHGIHGP